MLTWFLVAVVSQAAPLKVAAPDFTFVGLDPTLGAVFQDRFLGRLGSPELQVTTQRDVQQLLGLERQRELLGCTTTSTSCIAELAGALGVDAVLTGSLARSDSGFIVSLRVLRSNDGQPLATPNTRVSSEAALLDWLDETADALRVELLRATGRVVEARASPLARWVPGLVGGALIIGGGVCLGVSGANYAALTGPNPPPAGEISSVRKTGETLLPVGAALVGVGVVGLVGSLVWNAAANKPVQAALVPVREGAVLSVGGTFP
jgi:hypothetical protein